MVDNWPSVRQYDATLTLLRESVENNWFASPGAHQRAVQLLARYDECAKEETER